MCGCKAILLKSNAFPWHLLTASLHHRECHPSSVSKALAEAAELSSYPYASHSFRAGRDQAPVVCEWKHICLLWVEHQPARQQCFRDFPAPLPRSHHLDMVASQGRGNKN